MSEPQEISAPRRSGLSEVAPTFAGYGCLFAGMFLALIAYIGLVGGTDTSEAENRNMALQALVLLTGLVVVAVVVTRKSVSGKKPKLPTPRQ